MEKVKKHGSKFLALSIDDMKTGKRKKENTAVFTQQTKRPATLLKRDSNTSAFLWNFRNFKNTFSDPTPTVNASDICKILLGFVHYKFCLKTENKSMK